MSRLPWPFSHDEGPYHYVALGNGEYIRVVFAGDYQALEAKLVDFEEMRAAVERARSYGDESTMRDHIDDLLQERKSLYEQIRQLEEQLQAVRGE
jgi:hypothetical protein